MARFLMGRRGLVLRTSQRISGVSPERRLTCDRGPDSAGAGGAEARASPEAVFAVREMVTGRGGRVRGGTLRGRRGVCVIASRRGRNTPATLLRLPARGCRS